MKSQEYLNKIIKDWSERHKMILSEKKTKALTLNLTDKYKIKKNDAKFN